MLSDDQRRVLERLQRCGVVSIGEVQRGGSIHVQPESANTRGVRHLATRDRALLQQAFWPASGALIAHLLEEPPAVIHYAVTGSVTHAEGAPDATHATDQRAMRGRTSDADQL